MSSESRLVYPDADALARAAATKLAGLARESVAARGIFTLSLAGGSTPKRLYTLLGTEAEYRSLPWDKMHLFFGDERHVPPDHPDSNYGMVKKTLLESGLVPEKNVHRISAELPEAREAAAEYDAELHRFFRRRHAAQWRPPVLISSCSAWDRTDTPPRSFRAAAGWKRRNAGASRTRWRNSRPTALLSPTRCSTRRERFICSSPGPTRPR